MVDWKKLDAKWQKKWRENEVFEAKPEKEPKFYITVAYPYVSGPMHVGHARTYTIPDIIARYKRMCGYDVLFPMAFHFTGTPLVGASKRVQNRDEEFLETLTGIFDVEQEEIPNFEDPQYFGDYFARKSDLSYKKGMQMLGYSIDWNREFTTIDKQYKKFITWQYHKLMDMNLVSKGAHPVKWCPGCENPVTDHDLLEGEGVNIVEYSLLKFRVDDYTLPAATLRPETIFGVTNLWLNPEVDYLVAEINDEKWVLSEKAVEKLKNQGFRFNKITELKEQLIGREVEAPITNKKVPILPADFVNPENASGIVYSVPSHAPYDYTALLELQENPSKLRKYGINTEEIREIEPISLIKVPDYSESPAVEAVESEKITSQNDSKLEEITNEIYQKEFSKGRIREWVPEYAGMSVSIVKDRVHQELINRNEGSSMYEFSEKNIICRCGTQCMVKIVEDQWFLNYSNTDWKEKAHACLREMNLIPPETKKQFEYTIDWLEEWPCTRRVGMGTPAPWDKSWIIESLSDSTIYMIYYTISHIIKEINPEKLNDEFFDYILLGFGEPSSLSKSTGISKEKIEKMRCEVEHWYPLDYRISANELISNHLTFHIFHHVALFPKQYWPNGIASFGMALLEGSKMSSSKGNIIPINEATRKHGADAVRLYLASGVEPWHDFDWQPTEAKAMVGHLERFYKIAQEAIRNNPSKPLELTSLDRWILSKLQRHIQTITKSLDKFETRKAIQHAFFLINQDLKRYLKRAREKENKNWILEKIFMKWIRLLAPFTPHVCEDLWREFNQEGFVSLAKWPEANQELIDEEAEVNEEYLKSVEDDIKKIIEIIDVEKPERIYIYIAEEWKQKANMKAIKQVKERKTDIGKLIREARRESPEIQPSELSEFFKTTIKELRQTPLETIELISRKKINEKQILNEINEYLKDRFNVDSIQIFKADDPKRYDPQDKAEQSIPFKPAIYIE